jgi:hypothetical protein
MAVERTLDEEPHDVTALMPGGGEPERSAVPDPLSGILDPLVIEVALLGS